MKFSTTQAPRDVLFKDRPAPSSVDPVLRSSGAPSVALRQLRVRSVLRRSPKAVLQRVFEELRRASRIRLRAKIRSRLARVFPSRLPCVASPVLRPSSVRGSRRASLRNVCVR